MPQNPSKMGVIRQFQAKTPKYNKQLNYHRDTARCGCRSPRPLVYNLSDPTSIEVAWEAVSNTSLIVPLRMLSKIEYIRGPVVCNGVTNS